MAVIVVSHSDIVLLKVTCEVLMTIDELFKSFSGTKALSNVVSTKADISGFLTL